MARSSRREHQRVSAAITVKVCSPDGRRATTEQIRNISLGGVFIAMTDPLPFGTDVDLEFTLPVDHRTIRCKGFVVWSTKSSPERSTEGEGIGVRLMDIGVREMRLLNEFIGQVLRQK